MEELMKTQLFMAALLSLCLTVAVVLESATAKDSAHAFIEKATIGGQFEISSSRLALSNSQNADIKNFAQEMVDDHTQIGSKLKSVVAAENPDRKQPTIALDPTHRDMLNKLNTARGDDFDRLYVRDQIEAHKEAVDLFRDYSDDGADDALKAFATQTLPTLQAHQSHILDLQKSM
jgi:putative membrane protein